MSQKPLPFDIGFDVDKSRSATTYYATVNGEKLAIGRYAPGDDMRRNKLSIAWAADESLSNGCAVDANDIARVLQRAEIEASEAFTNEAASGEDEELVGEAVASYVDSNLIAELAWNDSQGRPDFIVFDRGARVVDRSSCVTVGGITLVPPAFWRGICAPMVHVGGSVLLPGEHDQKGIDEEILRGEIEAFIRRYVELPDDTTLLCVEYILMTWVYDCFDELPYLCFRTPDPGRGKSRARETIGSLCYRPLLAGGGSTPAALLRMLDIFTGTLTCDEFDMKRNSELAMEVTRLINLGFQRGHNLIKCDGEDSAPRPFRCYGPKMFALRGKFPDDASETRMISIWMQQRTRKDIPLNLPRKAFDTQALAIRNKLLAWRFANYGKITVDSGNTDDRLEDRSNQIGAALMAVAGTDEGRERIVNALLEQQRNVASDRAQSWAGVVLEAALAIAELGDIVRPGDIAKHINQDRASEQGIELDRLKDSINPWKVGQILKGDLAFPMEPKDKRGARYRLDRCRALQLCERFGVVPPQTSLTSKRHPSPETSRKNTLFESKNGGCDVSDSGDVCQGMPGETKQETTLDTSDDAERAAIMSVEADEENRRLEDNA